MKNTIFNIALTFLVISFQNCSGCYKQKLSFPTEDSVPPSTVSDIDGLYATEASSPYIEGTKWGNKLNKMNIDSLTKKTTCRIDRGRIIVIEDILFKPGAVIVKNLQKIDENRYKGKRIIPTGETSMYEANTTFYKTQNKGLIEEVEVPEEKRFWEKPFAGSFRYYLLESSSNQSVQKKPDLPVPSSNQNEALKVSTPVTEIYGYIKTLQGSGLNLRTFPSRDSESILLIPNGATVRIKTNNNKQDIVDGEKGVWYYLEYNGKVGWSWGKYIQISSQ